MTPSADHSSVRRSIIPHADATLHLDELVPCVPFPCVAGPWHEDIGAVKSQVWAGGMKPKAEPRTRSEVHREVRRRI